ncbi:hypothetical protein ONZ45_g15804 [Pleurotus djamor]|nr:hypothetical protein ONZ45_g15804 [Pleurotus djamor]
MNNTDHSVNVTNSKFYMNGFQCSHNPSTETLHGAYVDAAEQAIRDLKKRWPRVQLSTSAVMKCVEIKLKQTNHHLTVLAKLDCDEEQYALLESRYQFLRTMKGQYLNSRPSVWNPWDNMRYLYQICILKTQAKDLYVLSESVSEDTVSKNRSMFRSSRKNKLASRRSSPLPSQVGASATPESSIICDEAGPREPISNLTSDIGYEYDEEGLASDIVYNEVLDSDDENGDEEDDESEDDAPSTSHQSNAEPVVIDESNIPTPRVNTFSHGISS